MGGRESKSCISYEDAIKRVTPAEFRRIRETFKKLVGTDGTYLSKASFLQDVLSEQVPAFVADCLFAACGGTQKGISFKDLFCGLVLLTRGTDNEKIRFLWNLYCNDAGTYIVKSEIAIAINLERGTEKIMKDKEMILKSLDNIDAFENLFLISDRVNFEQFREWISSNKDGTILSNWILVDTCVSLTSELESPTFYQSLAGVTHLEEQDIGDLEKVFWLLKAASCNDQLDEETFNLLISPPIPRSALHGVFCAFDENQDGHIDFKELCCGISAACRGPSVERTKFCFKVFDADLDGILNVVEINRMIDILIFVAKESGYEYDSDIVNSTNVWNNLLIFTKSEEVNIPVNNGFNLTQEDFMMWTIESTLNLVQPFLNLLFDVCHVVLGLRPECKHVEHEIVKRWLSREVRRGYEVGQFWYLISAEWWQKWQQYIQSIPITQCASCRGKINFNGNKSNVIEEAIICDESFSNHLPEQMSSVGDSGGTLNSINDTSSCSSVGSSNLSTAPRAIQPPGPIDNTTLIVPNPYKSITPLTGEGARLKRNLLAQHRDFELVPDSLWKAFAQWYTCPIPLPRQVIEPPGSLNVELELYPISLRIQRHQNINSINQMMTSWGATAGGYGSIAAGGGPSFSYGLQPPKRYLAYTAAFSRLATVKQISEFLCRHVKIKQENVRLWYVSIRNDDVFAESYLLEDENKTLQDLKITDNDQILLEIRNKDLTWPEELSSLALSATSMLHERRGTITALQTIHAPGATGLHNLGNTCFMNAALQVLFNTQPLAQYFTKSMYLYEINIMNKFGTKGVLAARFGELLKEIWTSNTRSVAPLKLRFCITKYASQFAGGGQHDLQEFLEWLLDALHEDLNRVNVKTYSKLKDSDGRPDEEVATEAWAAHFSLNQSIVIELFYGQLKSRVSCLNCGRESVRFDPFSLLSLPLPVESFVHFEVLVILLDGSIPIKYGLRLGSESKYKDLKIELANLCNLDPNLMLICELFDSNISLILCDDQMVKQKNFTELHVYQLPDGSDGNRSHTSSIAGANIEKGLRDIQRTSAGLQVFAERGLNQSTRSLEWNPENASNKNLSKPKSTKDENAESEPEYESNFKSLNSHLKQDISLEEILPCGNSFQLTKDSKTSWRKYDKSTIIGNYLIAVHRKFSRQDTYLISHHKTRPNLFGIPLLIPYNENSTNKELYCAVWMQVANLLSPLPLIPPDQANHATDCDDSLGYDFPFILRAVSSNGRVCCRCPWTKFCRGCEIPCDNELLQKSILPKDAEFDDSPKPWRVDCKSAFVVVENIIHISIDWDPTALHLRYQSTREKLWIDHESVGICRRLLTEPVDLNHCLRTFTSEEKLEQWYHCSFCKAKTPATKKLQLWRLPPILIIHLKRFNCVNGKWVKSQKLVNFPFDDFDPTPFLAAVPQKALLRRNQDGNCKIKDNNNISQTKCEMTTIDCALQHQDKNYINDLCNIKDSLNANNQRLQSNHINCTELITDNQISGEDANDSGNFKDYHQHNLYPDQDILDVKYKLYAVVSHSGMLNGGHYVSYALNPNGLWYCYNDSSCREVASQSNIDPSSAYMLFYERKGLDYAPYLPNVEGRTQISDTAINSDDNENDLRKMCAIA